jgi:hypothetical protein
MTVMMFPAVAILEKRIFNNGNFHFYYGVSKLLCLLIIKEKRLGLHAVVVDNGTHFISKCRLLTLKERFLTFRN